MTSISGTSQHVQESTKITTVHRIYKGSPSDEIVFRDPVQRRSFINKSAYAKLQRSLSAGSKRHSVDNLKERFEHQNPTASPQPTEEVIEEKFTPASFGYPKSAKLVPPLIKPKPAIRPKPTFLKKDSKDENSNLVPKTHDLSDEERKIVLQPAPSQESVDKIAQELSSFEMDGRLKDKKRSSFRKIFMGGLFSKDKKKKDEEKNRPRVDNVSNDNVRNESFTRQSPQRQTVQLPIKNFKNQEIHEEKVKALENRYAELHLNRFQQIRHEFNGNPAKEPALPSQIAPKKSISEYIVKESYTPVENIPASKPPISGHVHKFIDTSSSNSTESERNQIRETPPRAQETHQNVKLVHPKASIPINSERSLPNPYQNERASPRTIERNLNRSNSKDYPDKATFASVESLKVLNSPKSPSLESTKLKLPPNREIYDLQPRLKSPMSPNRISTEKIIATELLKNNTMLPPVAKRVTGQETLGKPPLSPTVVRPEVTNVIVHSSRSSTPVDSKTYVNLPARSITPVNLRMSAALKSSPQKDDIRKSIEEYYWKELKKMKEEEDSKLIYSLDMSDYYDDKAQVRRSRSLSPHRASKKTLSLPRDVQGVNYVDYRMYPQQAIPEDHTLVVNAQNERRLNGANFARNAPERASSESLQRPIFRRGSLTKQEIYDNSQYNKRVSFSNPQWPTRNGFVQSPPQRRVDSDFEDDVFVPNEPVYVPRVRQEQVFRQDPVYSNRVLEQFRAQQLPPVRVQNVQQMGPRRPSNDSISRPREQQLYGVRMGLRPMSTTSEQYSYFQYPPNSLHSSRQSITDSNYGQKQVTVRNKYADFYGQIHDSQGVVMGQLQKAPYFGPPENFVRGSRLTSSANDIGKRQQPQYAYEMKPPINYENRPLPPPPSLSGVLRIPVSDTESGSDASEVQKIMQNKPKTKKRGFFGK